MKVRLRKRNSVVVKDAGSDRLNIANQAEEFDGYEASRPAFNSDKLTIFFSTSHQAVEAKRRIKNQWA